MTFPFKTYDKFKVRREIPPSLHARRITFLNRTSVASIDLFTRVFFRFSCLQCTENYLPVSDGLRETARRALRLVISRSTDKDVEKRYRERFILTDKHENDQQDGPKVRIDPFVELTFVAQL